MIAAATSFLTQNYQKLFYSNNIKKRLLHMICKLKNKNFLLMWMDFYKRQKAVRKLVRNNYY